MAALHLSTAQKRALSYHTPVSCGTMGCNTLLWKHLAVSFWLLFVHRLGHRHVQGKHDVAALPLSLNDPACIYFSVMPTCRCTVHRHVGIKKKDYVGVLHAPHHKRADGLRVRHISAFSSTGDIHHVIGSLSHSLRVSTIS